MAINGVVYSGKECQFGWAEEATFGTAIADASAFERLEIDSVTVSTGVTRHNQVKADGSRVRQDGNVYYNRDTQLTEISFTDMIVRYEDLGPLLYGVLQNVSEAAVYGSGAEFSVGRRRIHL